MIEDNTEATRMEPAILTEDQSIPVHIKCWCAGSDGYGRSLYPRACIEWQEGRLYIMCTNCGRLTFHDGTPESEEPGGPRGG